jgi:hypothetical protein
VKLTGVEHRLTKLEVKHGATVRAIKKQEKETDRRLGDLNHENARIQEFQSKVPSDDAFSALDERVKILEGTQFRLAGQAENRTESKSQANFNWNQAAQWAAVALLALVELRARGII